MAGEIMLRSAHEAEIAMREEMFASKVRELTYRRRDAYLIGGIIGGVIGTVIGLLLCGVVIAILLDA